MVESRYPKHVFWSDEDEGFIAVATDLPGSSAFGVTEAEALAELDQAIEAWIEAARAAGNAIPAPSRPAAPSLPSGKVLVRMPRELHQRAVLCAEREEVSLNLFIVARIAEAVGERSRSAELVHTMRSEPVPSAPLLLGSWVTGLSRSHGTAVIHGDGTLVGTSVLHTSNYYDHIESLTEEKQSVIGTVIAKKVSKIHARG